MVKPLDWHQSTWQQLVDLNKAQKLAHALMFTANNITSAGNFMQALAAQILCSAETNLACGQCKSCLLLEAGSHPDLMTIELEEKSKQIKIEQIRKVIYFDHQTAQISDSKLIVLQPIEAMNINAANALLKSLEEPSAQTTFLLATTKPSQVLPTIRSRCQVVHLKPASQSQALDWLDQTSMPKEDKAFWLWLSHNDPIKACDLYQVQERIFYQNFIDDLVNLSRQPSQVAIARNIEKKGITHWLYFMQVLIEALIQANLADIVTPEVIKPIYDLSQTPRFTSRAFYFLDQLNRAQRELSSQSNPNTLLIIESLLADWMALLK